ncbi:MAG: hypothetical protein ACRDGQ_08315 [Candidatus Limnocylindrales bacterium]
MIAIIRAHNNLNGLRFSAVEFAVVGAVAVVLATLFGSVGATLPAIVALGIAANAIPVIGLALSAIRRGEPDIGFRAMLRRDVRAQALREGPTMQRDTYILAGACLLPFVVLVAVVVDLGGSAPPAPR